jgi:hypothetical protein
MKQSSILNCAMIWGTLILAATLPMPAQGVDYYANLPKGASPQEVGKKVAEHFVASPHQSQQTIGYAEVCTWYGALTFAQLTHDEALRKELIARFEPLMPGGAEAALRPQRRHVDDSIFGVVPLEIAIETRDPKYLAEGISWADRQWDNPQPDGLSAETRYWVDDMYMLTMLQLQAFRATGDRKYLDRDAREMVAYLDKLQQHNGLFYHAPDVPFFWGRGNGWFAAGMAEMLRDSAQGSSPAGAHPGRLPAHDGRAVEVSGQGRNVASVDRPPGVLARELKLRDVYLRDDHGSKKWLARWRKVRSGGPQRMAGRDRLHRPEQRRDPGLRRHWQAERSCVLSGPLPPHRRLPRPGSDPVGRFRAAALGTTTSHSHRECKVMGAPPSPRFCCCG